MPDPHVSGAAIEGFELSASEDDLTYGPGMVNGTPVAGAQVTGVTVASGNTAKSLVQWDAVNGVTIVKGTDAASPTLPATEAGKIGLGSFTVSTSAITAVSLEGRGQTPAP